MSYYNHRNYQMDWANRRAAQQAQSKWRNAAQQQLRAINRVRGDFMRGQPGFGGSSGSDNQWLNYHIAMQAQPYGEEMENAHDERMAAMQNYMDSEMAQVQDRFADMGENRISSKNRSDEMAYDLERRRINAAKKLGQQQNNALSSLSNSLGSMDFDFETPQMPDTNLYDNNGERVGGSQYPSLFAQTGIRNSLMRA